MLSLDEWNSKFQESAPDGFDIEENGDEFIFYGDPYEFNTILKNLPEEVRDHGRIYLQDDNVLIYFYRSEGTAKFSEEDKAKITNFLQFTDSEYVQSEYPLSVSGEGNKYISIYCNNKFHETTVIQEIAEGTSLGFLTLVEIGYADNPDYTYKYVFGIEQNFKTDYITDRLGDLLKQNESIWKLTCPCCEQKSVLPDIWSDGYKCEGCHLPIPRLDSFDNYVDLTTDSYEEIVEKYRSVFEESIEVDDSNWFTKLRGEHIFSNEYVDIYRANYDDTKLVVVMNNVARLYSIDGDWDPRISVNMEQCSLCDNKNVEGYDIELYGIGEWGGNKINEPTCSECIEIFESGLQEALQELSGEFASELL